MKDKEGQSPSEKGTFQHSDGYLGILLPNIVENNLRKLKCHFFSNLQKEGQCLITGHSIRAWILTNGLIKDLINGYSIFNGAKYCSKEDGSQDYLVY